MNVSKSERGISYLVEVVLIRLEGNEVIRENEQAIYT